jgi:hypothetical protein
MASSVASLTMSKVEKLWWLVGKLAREHAILRS